MVILMDIPPAIEPWLSQFISNMMFFILFIIMLIKNHELRMKVESLGYQVDLLGVEVFDKDLCPRVSELERQKEEDDPKLPLSMRHE